MAEADTALVGPDIRQQRLVSKGSGRRPAAVDEQTLANNWDTIFTPGRKVMIDGEEFYRFDRVKQVASALSERQQDQKWVEDTRAANLAAADMVTPTGSQKDLSDGHSDEKWPKAAD